MAFTPHGPGFSFLDEFKILESGVKAQGMKWLDPHLPFFVDHFPGNPLMPGVLLTESGAQTAGALWQSISPDPSAFISLAQIEKFRLLHPVRPGEMLRMEVTLEKDFGSLARFQADIWVDPNLVASGVIILSRQRVIAPGVQAPKSEKNQHS
jgi:3-hydroxyacyl-[acyl-carrier-protein] dehydratase